MTFMVLNSKRDNLDARQLLLDRGLSLAPPAWLQRFRRITRSDTLSVGDRLKSWDLLRSILFLEDHIEKTDLVFDHGCFCSEMLPLLHLAGFNNLYGADFNPRVTEMPFSQSITYRIEDFMSSGMADSSLAAVTSVSVMEHGFDPDRLLRELARTLQPGGFYLSSFDYWPEKLDTSAIRFFDMSWTIFSRDDIEAFVNRAANFGLYPAGEMEFTAGDAPIRCAGFSYTFAWLALQKTS